MADAKRLAAVLAAACDAGDVASLLVPASVAAELAAVAQPRDVAVLVADDAEAVAALRLDGLQVEAGKADIAALRKTLGSNVIIGAHAGTSRHAAMEAAEAGADYVALSQKGFVAKGEPLVKWWAEFFEVPCIAFDPVEPLDLDILLPQNPDFIRPPDAMWESPEAARRIIGQITERLKSP